MNLGLEGKRALVLGGNKGLGRGVAGALAENGVVVAIAGRDDAALNATASALRVHSPRSFALNADLADPVALAAMLDRVDGAMGGIDILLLNGGGPPPFPAASLNIVQWRTQFETMFLSGVRIAAHFLPGMRERHWGRILVVSSTSVREPIAGLTASNALRAAVAGWAKSLAGEVAADGVTVNLLLAGRLATARTDALDRMDAEARGVDVAVIAAESQADVPVGRYGTADEFGAVAAFLASERASYVTGAAIPVDGGLSHAII
ncbi:SDR family oxidoreductase [Phyllobacterium myrsinacearum]|uniref:3-oxoacyl-ACP reductase n=1 Tax=Phyllobacterium myrsinacearum TaxID=28101 RepID=A0A2S9JYU8_9HYPH|nr:SDR family oxidoreductase [Phyllobacterium myrsinacearum]PRD58506.1 3-oxoacyl-ACP reductase [Phyllobacterium myrsinacearum]PWV96748.1 3-oxoacyl-[acyl-carrier protein] reductase [Phyllobacterium myrsinacearum]RZV09260.1 3-oxoacyl-[acyl-carrier protein] reductase [Phyllobacterium myrsinacearum]